MFVVTVTFRTAPEDTAAFLDLMMENATRSLTDEPGCLQFDVCTDPADPGEIFLYEVYTDSAAFDAHRETEHYRAFSEAVEPLVTGKDVRLLERVGTSA